MSVLVTGAAGFIGFHVSKLLLEKGETVVGIDNLNDYYDPRLKQDRLAQLSGFPEFHFLKIDVTNGSKILDLFGTHEFSCVVHLAAQAGVRFSIENPMAYIHSNVVGFQLILEACRLSGVEHLVYASSSSVYGNSSDVPFSTAQRVDNPVSTYAATKKSNELMAHVYSHLYGLPTTGLRFFTVYGPWGRPDMSPFIFTKAILSNEPIRLFNHGNHQRDFTYVDDITLGVVSVIEKSRALKTSDIPYKIYNIGNHQPVELSKYVDLIESALGVKAIRTMAPAQPGDVHRTCADISDLIEDTGFSPSTSLEDGIEAFVSWYREYYQVGQR
jgi:UDP-glucuronate 4-epimerase